MTVSQARLNELRDHMVQTANATARLIAGKLEKARCLHEIQDAINDVAQGAMMVALGSMMPIPTNLLASATHHDEEPGYHVLVYAHVKTPPRQIIGDLTAALTPHLEDPAIPGLQFKMMTPAEILGAEA